MALCSLALGPFSVARLHFTALQTPAWKQGMHGGPNLGTSTMRVQIQCYLGTSIFIYPTNEAHMAPMVSKLQDNKDRLETLVQDTNCVISGKEESYYIYVANIIPQGEN